MACCYHQSHLFSQENNHSQIAQTFVPSIGNTEKNVSFQLIGKTEPFLLVRNISAILLNYPTIESGLFMFSWTKEVLN